MHLTVTPFVVKRLHSSDYLRLLVESILLPKIRFRQR
jgi:hypothetical protein